MENNNNWRANPPGAEPVLDSNDWRSQLQADSRGRIVNKIMETLKRHLPFSGQEGLNELRKIAVRFEEKIYTAATSQSDYLRKISLKMLTMETKSQTNGNAMPTNSAGNSSNPPDRGPIGMPPQVHGQGQSIPIPLTANQTQPRQQLLPQNIPNNMSSAPVQSSTGLPSLPQSSNLTQTSLPNMAQNSNMQPSLSGVSQNSAGNNSMGQGTPANVFVNSQRQIQGRQPQQQGIPQQGQQQPQNTQQYLYQQQIQQQMMKQKFQQQGNISQPMMQPHMQQQGNLSQTNHMQSSLQQSAPSMLQHSQSIMRQPQQTQSSSGIQQPSMGQQSMMAPQQQQQLIGQQSNASNMQQNQNSLMGQQTNVGNMQQNQNQLIGQQNNVAQQQQRLIGQQGNSLPNLQQQQLMANNISNLHQQQLDSQSNISQQQQLLGQQSSLQMLQQPKGTLQQQGQQTSGNNLLSTQAQSQQQQQQQMMSQMQTQPTQMGGMQQQQSNVALQRDLQQRLQASGQQQQGSLLQQQNVIDQQKQQMYQSQRPLPESSSTSQDSTAQTSQSNGGDWQEEVYQKIKAMKDMYFPELSEMYQKIASKLQQHESQPLPTRSDQLEKLKIFKTMLERIISFLQVPKENVQPTFKEKLGSYEKQIINFINTNRPRKPGPSSLQQGQINPSQIHSMQQPQSQMNQMQSHENQMNPQMQTMNLQGPMSGMNNSAPQNMINSPQQGSNLESGQSQANQLSSMGQVGVGSVQQNTNPQQANINSLTSQNMLQPNINQLQSNNMLQHQHLKQQEHQMMQTQQIKQMQQRQMQQHMMQKQQILQQQQQQQTPPQHIQQLHQQAKPQLSGQLPMNDVNDMKMRQGFGIKPGAAFQQNMGQQRAAYPHQQLKSGASFPISSPQMPQAASPQLLQHSSPQVDQQNLLSTLTRTGTPLQSANSPFIVPSPSTPLLAPSPMPGESEKLVGSISSLSNAGSMPHQQTTGPQTTTASSLAIGTPGISASPLLAEFTSPDATHANALPTTGKPAVTENPIERLMRAVNSASTKALSAAVNDIGSVVSMMDRIAGSAPGNGSRAAVGEDLVAMTKCRLQARNFITQDGVNGTKKMRRYTSAMPLNAVSPTGSMNEDFGQLAGSETSDLELTKSSCIKRRRVEVNHTLSKEISDLNQRLVDTVVAICDEDDDPTTTTEGGEGTIVKFSFVPVALCPQLKAQYASAQVSPIQPLRLLVPTNYPSSSPILLDKLPVEVGKENEDLSTKAKSMFSRSLRNLSQPMSLGDLARTWDGCNRAAISDYAQNTGGGTFSSKYGTWEQSSTIAS
ncbi:hypothetical protein ACFE04_014823 [Oxalis oulophora]